MERRLNDADGLPTRYRLPRSVPIGAIMVALIGAHERYDTPDVQRDRGHCEAMLLCPSYEPNPYRPDKKRICMARVG